MIAASKMYSMSVFGYAFFILLVQLQYPDLTIGMESEKSKEISPENLLGPPTSLNLSSVRYIILSPCSLKLHKFPFLNFFDFQVVDLDEVIFGINCLFENCPIIKCIRHIVLIP